MAVVFANMHTKLALRGSATAQDQHGLAWATHQDKPVLGQRWRLDRNAWEFNRRSDITMTGVAECRQVLGIDLDSPPTTR